jgi:class 3 adenylate cyclase
MEGWSVGVGIASGEAFVGNVGGGDVTDDTVLGDTVNVAARLQGEAAPARSSCRRRLMPQWQRNFST